MTSEEELIKKRFAELANKSLSCGYFLFTDFLGLSDQSLFNEAKKNFPGVSYVSFGGAEGAERVMIRFGDEEELGYSEEFPIRVIKVEPKAPKFAHPLSHRDFLGATLNLGIERSVIGDIAIIDNVAYIFARDDIADYIAESLVRVRNTDVITEIIPLSELPSVQLYQTHTVKIQLSGERLDAAIAKVFCISRDDALSLFRKHLVFVCGRLTENNSYTPRNGDIISVRGYGRFIYRGVSGVSKKGKLNVEVDVY